MGTAEGPNPGQDLLWPLVEALQNVSCLTELSGRNLIVRMLSDELHAHLPVEEHPNPVFHIYSIVDACRQRFDGLPTLVEVLDRVEQGSNPVLRVRQVVQGMTALEIWPQEERDRLFDLLRGVVIPDIGDIYQFVAGPDARALVRQTTFPEVFLALEMLNANPDGLPKPLVFVEYLATRVRFELASELRRWADQQASRFGVITELQAVRRRFAHESLPAPPPKSHAYLVLLLQPEGPSGEVYRISHWFQLDVSDGWHPDRGPDFVGRLPEVRRRVAELAENTAEDWAQYEPEIRVEFILSSELLNLAVDQWQWETDTAVPEPVGCRFPVVVRSLDRMTAGKWHGSWRTRWRELQQQLEGDGTIPVGSCHQPANDDLRKLTAVFEQDPRLVSLILGAPPEAGLPGQGQVLVGLRAGIPVMVWHRRDCGSREFIETVEKLLHADGPSHLLERARFVRASALAEGADHVGSQLTILWDDPDRLVVPRDAAPPERVGR
ncbi:MAG TPA: hypothetical protein VJT49_22115 [Amycolatopsis sp.]|uniref:VMAP-C domain-containing protein n=1 Tax=Amycolatopsis sp. TaxID=37632 RepID=UPI002B47BDB9|nr:hypothetical protein [Amycolatopsis sp.]HKS47756.1 hypothetical protein [Amycolatopsis sp.]